MNQAIAFPELEQWDAAGQQVCFPALVNGFRVQCRVSASWLQQHFAPDGQVPDCLALFRQYRWDIEELMEQCIRQEDGQDGNYALS